MLNKNSLPAIIITIFSVAIIIASVFYLSKAFADPSFDQQAIVYYYGITCPHCKDVEQFIQDNDLHDKLDFEKKEVYQNTANATELSLASRACGMNDSQVGVPFLYAKGKCYVGTPDIITYFEQYISNEN